MLRMENNCLLPSGSLQITRGHEQAHHNTTQYVAWKRQVPDALEHLGGHSAQAWGKGEVLGSLLDRVPASLAS